MKVKLWFEGGDVTHYDITKICVEAPFLVLETSDGCAPAYYWSSIIEIWAGPEDEVPVASWEEVDES